MARAEAAVAAALTTALLVATLPAPAAAFNCVDTRVQSLERAEGRTHVLQDGVRGGSGAVYVYGAGGQLTDRHLIGPEINRTEPDVTDQYELEVTAVEPGPEGGWWVLTRDGRVFRFDAGWNYTGRSRSLAGPSAYDLEQTPRGWWLLDDDGVRRFDSDWTAAERYDTTAHTGHPALGLHAAGDRLWILDAGEQFGSGGTVARFSVTGGAADPSLSFDRSRNLDWETADVVDLARAGDGGDWLVVEDDGGLARYTDYWQFTGAKREVTDAVGNCASVFGPVATAAFFAGVGIVSLIGLAGLVFRSGLTRGRKAIATATVGWSWLAIPVFWFHVLPAPAAAVYLLPDAVQATAFVGSLGGALFVFRGLDDYGAGELTPRRCAGAVQRHPAATLREGLLLATASLPLLVLTAAIL